MRVRVRFSKQEPLQYIGHLDVMRFFQKAIRRAQLPAQFSEGFSPHIILSFASPLGVGKISEAEYFDLELTKEIAEEEITTRLQAQMVPGIDVRGVCRIADSKKANGMRQIAAAAYTIRFPDTLPAEAPGVAEEMLSRTALPVWQKSKKKEGVVDLRPGIYTLSYSEHELSMLVSASSARNVRPELVAQLFLEQWEKEIPLSALRICRKELYANRGTEDEARYVSLLTCDRWTQEPKEALFGVAPCRNDMEDNA